VHPNIYVPSMSDQPWLIAHRWYIYFWMHINKVDITGKNFNRFKHALRYQRF